ncbi:MAG: hypothetical protein MZU84_08675 [Sphingobacterium sp.]|nr:hypothetical protein [Sphingobacterium sp.]
MTAAAARPNTPTRSSSRRSPRRWSRPGARGTVQLVQDRIRSRCSTDSSSPGTSSPSCPTSSWPRAQYNEIKALVEKGEPVELEFDIRNWFKMGPVKYHSVVATLRGTEFPDEYVVLGGHFDCFSARDRRRRRRLGLRPGHGGHPAHPGRRRPAQALDRRHRCSRPRRSAWSAPRPGSRTRPDIAPQDRDDDQPRRQPERHHRRRRCPRPGSPISRRSPRRSRTVNPRWPFKLERGVPRANATSPGGSDSLVLRDAGRPDAALPDADGLQLQPRLAHPRTTSTASSCPTRSTSSTPRWSRPSSPTASANLDKPLTRDGVYLPDGLYADIAIGAGDSPAHIMTHARFRQRAPRRRPTSSASSRARAVRRRPGRRTGAGMRPGGRGRRSRRSARIEVRDGVVAGLDRLRGPEVRGRARRCRWRPIPPSSTTARASSALSGPNAFHLTLQQARRPRRKSATAIGKTIAGLDLLQDPEEGRPHPEHPDRPGGPGGPRLQDRRRSL